MTEERTEPKRKKNDETEPQDPVLTVREGAVAASIWRRQSPAGYAYFDFSLSRSWKSMTSGKTGYSKNFFGRHKEELLLVIERVAGEIAKLEAENGTSAADESLAA